MKWVLLFISISQVTSTYIAYLEPVVVHNATLGTLYTKEVNQSTEFLFEYTFNKNEVGDSSLRVYIESDESKISAPVLIVVRYEKGVLSWQLPLEILDQDFATEVVYTAANRTICPEDVWMDGKGDQRITISISTASKKPMSFSMSLYLQPEFKILMNQNYTTHLTPSAPQFFQFLWPDDVDTAIIHVTSEQDYCMIMSVQNITCPVLDLNKNVFFDGLYQTVDLKTGMSITRDRYPKGIHLVFVEMGTRINCFFDSNKLPDDITTLESLKNDCHGPCKDKYVNFHITKKITKNEYLVATFGAFGMFVGAYLLVILVSCILFVRGLHVPSERTLYERGSSPLGYSSFENQEQAVGGGDTINASRENLDEIDCVSDDSSIDEDDIDMLTDADDEKEVFRTKTVVYVSDLARKSPSVLRKKASLYHWNLITIAIFYGLPVIQLVVTYQQVLNKTGNEDLCYYNFLCAHPLGQLSDFNHVFSNLGYVMLGGLFMIFVWRREFHYSQLVKENPGIDRKYGIPHHCGLFYAMGFALVMEGLMSGCYHICPNHSNFQFDTAFMYTIAILCMLKIYQFRHPDINANSYTAFGVLAFVIFVGVLGVVNGSFSFWIIFTFLYIIVCFVVSLQIYYMGRWKLDWGIPKRLWLGLVHDINACCTGDRRALRPIHPDRIILLVIFNMINWVLAGLGIKYIGYAHGDFASFLLGVLIINLLMYTLFYILMKLRHKERLTPQPIIYIILSSITWAGAMYFFINKSTSWVLSPALSRRLNTECKLFNFYDNHDIWHFLSATSLFLSFMILLTLDDDLAEKPRNKIPVF